MLEMIEDIDPGAISETIVVLLPHLQTGQLALPSSDKNNYSIYMKSYRIMLFNLKKSTHSLPHERFVQSKPPRLIHLISTCIYRSTMTKTQDA